jgi:heat shock protein HslJ
MRISMWRCAGMAAVVVLLSACSLDAAMSPEPPPLLGAHLAPISAHVTALADTSWRASLINDGNGGTASLVAGTEVTLEFDTGSGASGSSGCNRYTARYTSEGSALTFGQPATTRKMCVGPGVMEQEQQYLRALQGVASARVEGDRLELRDADGALAVAFHRSGAS